MKTRQEMQAEELDAYLTHLQSGTRPLQAGSVAADETALLEGLLALAEAHAPAPDYVDGLERQLQTAVRGRQSAPRRRPRQGGFAGMFARGETMNARWVLGAGALALAAILLIAFSLLQPGEWPNDDQVVQGATPTTPATVPPAPIDGTETPARPEVTPPAWPAEPPALARLAVQGGLGGSGGSSETPPPAVTYILNATLPEGPAHLAIYAQRPELLTIERAAQAAQQWGLEQAVVYQSLWMTVLEKPDEFSLRWYAAVDGQQQLACEGTERLFYRDGTVPSGDWCRAAGNLPSLEAGVAAATEFLSSRGLLDPASSLDTRGYAANGTLRFQRTLDGRPLVGADVEVTIGGDGRVAGVTYNRLDLGSLGDYALISAQEAWELVGAADAGGRVWYSSLGAAPQPQCPPRTWQRSYAAGQQADLFGPLGELYAVEPGVSPYVRMNGLRLVGDDLLALVQAYRQLTATTGDSETPIHVWGAVQDGGDELLLQVAGWDCSDWRAGATWSGTVQRRDGQGVLVTDDGTELVLPDLPVELADGTRVFVNGVLWNEQIEWWNVQEFVVDGGMPAPQPGATQAVVEQVELIYYASPAYRLAQDVYADFGARAVQPVWRLSGHTDQGVAFEVYVQAVAETQLEAVGAAPAQ